MYTIQYNILLLQWQTDRCESDIHNDMQAYDSITDNCHAGQYCMGNTAYCMHFLIIIFVCYLFFLPFVVNKDFQ